MKKMILIFFLFAGVYALANAQTSIGTLDSWTRQSSILISPRNSTMTVLIGETASTTNSIFEVNGNSTLKGNLTVTGTCTGCGAAVGAWATSSDNYNFATLLAGTTTDALPQGSLNKYYSTSLFAGSLAGTTTTALNEGTNLYWTNTRFDNRLSASTSISGITTLPNLSLPSTQISGAITAASSTLLSDRNSFSGINTFSSKLGIGTTSPIGDLVIRGHIQTGSAAVPVATTCGTSPVVLGSDHTGRVVIGGGVISSCQVSFNKAWTNPPACVANDESAILLTRIVATSTGMTISVATTFQGDTVDWMCTAFE